MKRLVRLDPGVRARVRACVRSSVRPFVSSRAIYQWARREFLVANGTFLRRIQLRVAYGQTRVYFSCFAERSVLSNFCVLRTRSLARFSLYAVVNISTGSHEIVSEGGCKPRYTQPETPRQASRWRKKSRGVFKPRRFFFRSRGRYRA